MNAPTAFPDQKPVPPYKHTPLFPLGADTTPYKKITTDGVRVEKVLGKDMLVVSREALRALSEAAFGDINHYLRPGHLKQLANILEDKEASDNDKFVAFDFLKNANIAAGGVLPMCQDTGTAIIMGKKGARVITDGDDEAALSEGARDAYLRRNLRYSQVAPISMYEEKNTANNMPAQCEIYAEGGSSEIDLAYKFMFMAKGGGSANKSFLFQATPSVLTKDRLLAFLKEKVLTLGTAACPPYHLAIVIGGTSAELCMKTVKLASARYLDALPTHGSADGNAFRDLEMEQEILKMTQSLGVGAQFGGKYFCHDVRVIRMPRHGASLPIGLGVSCSADRQVLGKITKDGVYLEELEHNPAQYLPAVEQALGGEVVKIDLNQPMKDILATLSKHPIKTRVSMTGTMIVARDSAHAKLRERLEKGEPLPDYFKNHPVYYAGPAKTPDGYASGAFGPTTAGRMDSFVDQFQAAGGSMVMVAKGNRAVAVREACKKHGGFYLGSIGGAAANLAEHCIKKVEVVEYPELGMEAIWRIEVVDFPAFIIIDDKGNDFFKELNLG
ncbi:fumarate hydratase [Bradyrhizobium sp. AUGA SZCCT0240]|uniref:fumarate hydratase n=1 Tax=unclassified Bradyrhizobium TaxID=2631580 RepID=UPI001BA53B25|nr:MULTISPECIES: fumarate hydratase [unclassified Bradyrhizobium]MBR1192625.1 fumarate hydratase [Bradyrhizobium sp. AUGA SZCCT0160]MBR1199110.1 fumarate hydratase [Bradyrhizobium sp. AUGA SZCCT0158]MBR1238704.1 fumarate hydratase [Bradyrhizobium sp. AUGA SZCCT0274]MBR1247213.1 fumarate hydratase [Bradyrhizobium sp. AUGA SZCCT0169]MBR1253608.1 fumarate hydratase [Bradyrhizobium sp. AUGA SZCCT0240]